MVSVHPMVMCVVDADSLTLLAVTDAAAQSFGYAKEQLLGMALTDIQVEETSELEILLREPRVPGSIAGGKCGWSFRKQDGHVVPAELTAVHIEFQGRPAVLLQIDGRERATEYERELVDQGRDLAFAGETLEAFRHLLSHDMRSPLMVIDGFGQQLAEQAGPALGESGLRQLSRIRQAGRHLSVQIENMLVLARVTRQPMATEVVDLSAICRVVIQTLRAAQPQRQVRIEIDEGMQCMGDPALLKLALSNLIDNAWKFTSGRKVAMINIGRKPTGVCKEPIYSISDNGAGFDMAHAEKLFLAFRRLHSERQFPGLGVGLAIAHRIVARHRGKMWVESQQEVGSTFFFTLGHLAALPSHDLTRGVPV
jgi:PAS domain S-box-containing protein